MMVEWSNRRRSNIRTDPSAPTDAKMSFPCANAKSKTSLSCAISCVRAFCVEISHIVQVVSIDAVPIKLGSVSFQSNEVSGAQYSLFLFFVVLFVCFYRRNDLIKV